MIQNTDDFTHFNEQGCAKMVDVGEKSESQREAIAGARVLVSPETFERIRFGGMKKGDVLTVAQIAGIMGQNPPQYHPHVSPCSNQRHRYESFLNEECCSVEIEATVSCSGCTGAETEALTAVTTAALTVYNMCKAVQKDIVITDIRLLKKTGGIYGDFERKEN